ncbi:MAG: Cytochrome C biogenesis protein transmembrane region [Methanocella sp. PtaU1.Bin125]|nr:MAG: Cytochrome C biogenesis protein transmembrane region [Methanocella sp. PtaU1.Bin125]
MRPGCRVVVVTGLLLAFLTLAVVLQPPVAGAPASDDRLQITYVFSQQCLSCKQAWPAIERAIDGAGHEVSLSRLEIATREGAEYARAAGISSVPAVVVNCGPPVRLEDYDSVESFERALRERIACEAGNGPCNGTARHQCTAENIKPELSVPAVFAAGLIAGINPCLLAVMVFIAGTTLSTTGRRTDIIARILSFCAGLMAVYLLIGVGLMELIARVPGLESGLKATVIGILIVLAGWSFIDAYQVKKGVESRSFRAILERSRGFYHRYGLPASFLIGMAFGLVKMPCVGGLYIAILGTILQAGQTGEGILYLVVYNLGVIAPVLALGALLTLGMSPGTVNRFRHRYRVELKAFNGVLLAAMAAGFATGLI